MSKNKIIAIVGSSAVLVVGLGIGGWWTWHNHQTTASFASTSMGQVSTGAVAQTQNLQATTGQSIPLTGAASSQDSGGLRVSNGTGNANLGQLDPNASVNANNGTGNSGNSSNSGSSSSSNTVDPTKFTQYDQYKDSPNTMFGEIVKGTGATLGANQKASVVYAGWLTNGTLFDKSKTGSDGKLQAFSFTEGAGQVIRGWEEGTSGMQVGGTRLIIVPPKLGYGATGQGSIPGNSVLVFEVKLLAVQ
jgi:FKBP-type peptidyl-prolyl cis-trans isomerase